MKRHTIPLWAITLITSIALGTLVASQATAEPIEIDPCLLNPDSCLDPPPELNICNTNPDFCSDPPPPAPDLRIVGIGADINPDSGICEIKVAVENAGPATGSFDLDVFFDCHVPPEIGDLSYYYVSVPGAPASSPFDIFVPIPAGYSGSQCVSALVDSTRNVAESNEHNNMWFRCDRVALTCLS